MPAAGQKQREAILHGSSDDFVLVAQGAVRSGKTAACIAGHALYTLTEEQRQYDHFVVGVTEGALLRNIIYPPISYLSVYRALGLRPYTATRGGFHICVPLVGRIMRIWIMGSADSTVAVDRMAGATLGSIHFDEGARVPEAVWDMALSRLTAASAKVWTGLNPGGVRHWFARRFIRGAQAEHARILDFRLDDNPGLAPGVKTKLMRSFAGHQHRRLILGEWCDASGQVWPLWEIGEVGDAAWGGSVEPAAWSVGLDWSSAGPWGAVAVAHPDESMERGVVVAEHRHDPAEDDTQQDAEHGRHVAAWMGEVTGAAPSSVRLVVSDDTPETLRGALEAAGYRPDPEDGDLIGGLQATGARLGAGDWRISEGCRSLIEELAAYIWDAEWAERGGADRPEPMPAPLCTALRYVGDAAPTVEILGDALAF